MNKLERLLNLTAALLATNRPLSATDIRERVPGYPDADASFRRAFERDKDDLREMGIPVTVARVGDIDPPLDGYLIPKDKYYLPDPDLAADELAALHLAANAVRVDGLHGMEAFWKLGGVVNDDGAGDAPEVAALPADKRLAIMFTALLDRRSVSFVYNEETRRVDPHRLDFNRGRWYLTGYDHAREGNRNFRFDRIDGDVDVVGDEQFERPATDDEPAGVQRQPWELGGEAPVTARLLIDADQAAWAVRHLGEDLIDEVRPDGSVVAQLAVSNRAAFRSFVLTFLDHAEILDPPELRSEIVEWLEAMAQ